MAFPGRCSLFEQTEFVESFTKLQATCSWLGHWGIVLLNYSTKQLRHKHRHKYKSIWVAFVCLVFRFNLLWVGQIKFWLSSKCFPLWFCCSGRIRNMKRIRSVVVGGSCSTLQLFQLQRVSFYICVFFCCCCLLFTWLWQRDILFT